MKTGLSFVTLTGAAVLALGVSAAQARNSGSQATTAQTQVAKKVAQWYQAEDRLFKEFNERNRYQTPPGRAAEGIRGEPPWTGDQWTARFCTRKSVGSERCII
jgi:hypothetical protein